MSANASRIAAGLFMAAVATTGCASRGNDVLRTQDTGTVDQLIIDGKTTRSDVERIYGPPNATSFANAQTDIWIYRWSRATAKAENFIPYVGAFVGGADVQNKELVILFNEQNVVVRHSMRDSTDAVRRNLSASASPTGSSAQIATSPSPSAASAEPSARSSAATQPVAAPMPSQTSAVATAASIAAGNWSCGINNSGNASNPRYTINFTVATDRSITVLNYGNAPATVVKTNPLTFTAVNPRGSRLTTFVLKRNNSMVVTGPGLNNPAATFYDEGTCIHTGGGGQTSDPTAAGQSRSRL